MTWLGFTTWLTGMWVWMKWICIIIARRMVGKETQSCIKGWSDEGLNRVLGKLNVRVELDNQIKDVPNDRPIIVVGNHPISLAIFAAGRGVNACMPEHEPKVVMAMKHNFNPLGWALHAMRAGIAVNRRNGKQAVAAIRKGIGVGAKKTFYLIFPEGHRPYSARITENRNRLYANSDYIAAQRFRYTLSGYPTGVLTLRESLPNAFWMRMYISFDRPEFTLVSELHQLQNSVLHIHLSPIETPPETREGVIQWLNESMLGPCNDWIYRLSGRAFFRRRKKLAIAEKKSSHK